MNQENKLKSGALLVFILTTGVFGIINTEIGVIDILPLITEAFHVTVPEAGWTVSVFALVVSYEMGMLFFTVVNALVLLATILFVPSMPVHEKLFFLGEWLVAMAIIILSLGIFAGYGQNTMQYMITHAAAEAPDFANALYLLSTNLGTMLGVAVCGAFITAFDTSYSVFGSLLFLVVGIESVVLRIPAAESKKQIEIAIAA